MSDRHVARTRAVATIEDRLKHYAEQPIDDAFAMRGEVSLLRTLRDLAMDRLLDRDTPEFRSAALALYEKSQSALASGDGGAAAALLTDLGELLRVGVEENRIHANVFAQTSEILKRCLPANEQVLKYADVIPRSEAERYARAISGILKTSLPHDLNQTVSARIDTELFGGRLRLGSDES